MRESFGFGDGFRPAGGKGDLRAVPLHTTLGGFWSEYPANKASAWLTSQAMVNGPPVYEWRLDGSTGALLATGVVDDLTWNRMELRVDPVTKSVSASINGALLGTQPFASVPKYAGFEGVGVLDNFVIRLAP